MVFIGFLFFFILLSQPITNHSCVNRNIILYKILAKGLIANSVFDASKDK
ncbi:hypothetical protein LY11_04407 [Pedobacter cryoconitis]|uniref:Uncharacterized protein n=1 Tax=Pedobacter cryoconitis TaxID=188932 RepID=A0A327SFM8_9SPHI|nr:hypothetical protein LY11_04407 [Pedobacter cryoconitis]